MFQNPFVNILLFVIFSSSFTGAISKSVSTPIRDDKIDSLPLVLTSNRSDLIESRLRNAAVIQFAAHRLPDNMEDWMSYRTKLKNTVAEKTGVYIDHKLPLDIQETATLEMSEYSIKSIYFQTRPGIYATANLYIPNGRGPFPAVINMSGHWMKAKLDSSGPQALGHSLALNGYVCLSIDPWGSGERSTTHGEFEYHGSNLGASLMNIGESLIGMQISDNIRGVDLLCSLPYVDQNKIGATGASGGGNQTMWLAAMDERIKAAVPVVSVGSFESYVMRSNCICETLVDGLTFTEEAGVLALANAIMPCNHQKDSDPAFYPSEMLRSYNNAKAIFEMEKRENDISYRIFDLTHGYHSEDRKAMLGWFDLKLKGIGNGSDKEEIPFNLLPAENLMTFSPGKRDDRVLSTAEYCKIKGKELRMIYLEQKSFDVVKKRVELAGILRIDEKSELKKAHKYGYLDGWERIALETTDGKLIPILLSKPKAGSTDYVLVINSLGKQNIPASIIDKLKKEDKGIILVDLLGTGEASSARADAYDRELAFHTLSRAELWLGKTTIGEWVKELELVTEYIMSEYGAKTINIDGNKEVGLAGLFLGSMNDNVDNIILRNVPVSYLFDNRESVDYFNMAIHLPGILNWGDISLLAALSGKNITFVDPVTMSGGKISKSKLVEYQKEFEKIRSICNQPAMTYFE